MGVVPKPPIVWVGAAAGNYGRGRPAVFNEGLVCHTTAGGSTIEGLDAWFNDPAAGVATTFGIGRDATGSTVIHQYVSLGDVAYAQGVVNRPTARLVLDNGSLNPNLYLLGCELVDGGIPGNHTQEQRDLLAWLWAWLWEDELMPHASVTGITDTADRYRLIGHCEIDSVNRAGCPGWPAEWWDELVAGVNAWLHPVPPEPQPEPPPSAAAFTQLVNDYTATAMGLEDLAARATLQAQAARDAIARATAGG